MPTYIQKTTASDLSLAGATATREMSSGTGADTSFNSAPANAGGQETHFFVTVPNKPNNDDWEDGGTQTVEIEIDTGDAEMTADVRVGRVNAAGTIIQVGSFVGTQALDIARTFSPVAPTWEAEEDCGNRLFVEVLITNNAAHGSHAVDIGLGTALNEVVTDVTEEASACADSSDVEALAAQQRGQIDPVRIGAGALMTAALFASGMTYVGEPIIIPDYGWFEPLSEPVRDPFPQRATQAAREFQSNEILSAPPVIVPDYGWFRSLSEPTLPTYPERAAIETSGETIDPVALTLPEQPFLPEWFVPLSEPTLPFFPEMASLESSGETHANEILPAPPEDITLDKWFQPLSEPVLPLFPERAAMAAGEFSANEILPVVPIAVPDYGWFAPFAEPVRPPFPAAAMAASGEEIDPVALTLPEQPFLTEWFVPLSEPTLPAYPERAAQAASGETHANEILPPVSVAVPDYGWFAPLSEPVRAIPPLPLDWGTIDPVALTLPEQPFLSEWFVPLSEPVREPYIERAAMAAGEFSANEILPSAEEVTLDKWFMPLSEPTRARFMERGLFGGEFHSNEILPTPILVPVVPEKIILPARNFTFVLRARSFTILLR